MSTLAAEFVQNLETITDEAANADRRLERLMRGKHSSGYGNVMPMLSYRLLEEVYRFWLLDMMVGLSGQFPNFCLGRRASYPLCSSCWWNLTLNDELPDDLL